MPAPVIAVGQPANDSERRAIATLRDGLPNGYHVLHNFEIRANNQVYEIDIAVIAPHCVYVLDVKGTRGNIEVYGSKWYPEHHGPYPSPLAKLRLHAKVLKSLIRDANPTRHELKSLYVHAAILLTADDANLIDPNKIDSSDVTTLKKCLGYLQSQAMIPSHLSKDIRALHKYVFPVFNVQAKPRSATLRFGDWSVEEKLSAAERYTDYRARRSSMGSKGITARLRVYKADPYKEAAERESERKLISNAYRTFSHMPGHPNILNVRDFFENEAGDQFVLVTEDLIGWALSQHLRKRELALTIDQKFGIIRGVLDALGHAHQYQVVHRNLTPDAILISADAQPRLTEFDYARTGSNRSSTIGESITDEFDTPYLAPECYREPKEASAVSDLYAAGAVIYELLTGQPPYESFEDMFKHEAIFPSKASELQPGLPKGMDEWLQKLCSFKREDRYQTAASAKQEFERILVSASGEDVAQEIKEPSSPPASLVAGQIDYGNLPDEAELNNRYVVKARLGGGGFAVAYKVFDSMAQMMRVIKITTRDRISHLDRFLKEYRTLTRLQNFPHPHV